MWLHASSLYRALTGAKTGRWRCDAITTASARGAPRWALAGTKRRIRRTEKRTVTAPGRGHWLLVRRSLADPEDLAYYVCFGATAAAPGSTPST